MKWPISFQRLWTLLVVLLYVLIFRDRSPRKRPTCSGRLLLFTCTASPLRSDRNTDRRIRGIVRTGQHRGTIIRSHIDAIIVLHWYIYVGYDAEINHITGSTIDSTFHRTVRSVYSYGLLGRAGTSLGAKIHSVVAFPGSLLWLPAPCETIHRGISRVQTPDGKEISSEFLFYTTINENVTIELLIQWQCWQNDDPTRPGNVMIQIICIFCYPCYCIINCCSSIT